MYTNYLQSSVYYSYFLNQEAISLEKFNLMNYVLKEINICPHAFFVYVSNCLMLEFVV